ncbi:hypothetical protein [Azospirillum halopraeferens]|uniref:hypothetical protein n=1 Tax=Azospirillum halopraeferens TaxID=34010 RepID=UPI0003FD63C2|nr:hypothetical protein [Azospirillum halopraeferens]
MSARTIVLLGVWILVMVLIGTLTVGMTPGFYLGTTAFFAVVVAVLMVVSRGRSNHHRHY